jgi:16S rRNA (cytosine967-C5)-methyltransferase
MQYSARINACTELLATTYEAWAQQRALPMDSLMASYFRQRRYIGAKDRVFIADLTYLCLREQAALGWHVECGGAPITARSIMLAALYFLHELPADEIIDLYNDDFAYSPAPLTRIEREMLSGWQHQAYNPATMPDSARYNVPQWTVPYFKAALGDNWPQHAQALNQQAPIDLRVNTLKCPDRETLLDELRYLGLAAEPTPHSPLGVRVAKRFAAHSTDIFRDGYYEMQDEGSQMLAALVAAKPGDKVIDFCAGAGGKTLAIAAAMRNKGRILALDTAEHRLKQIKPRLARAGVDNVQTHVLSSEADPWLKRHKASADWVLIDAPCSGSGTWRRNPDLKWRFGPEDLQQILAIQAKILQEAAKLVRPGGYLVYMTCSLWENENNSQIKQFINSNPNFTVAHTPELWNKSHPAAADCSSLQLTPLQDGTDGFFAAIMQRHQQ